MRAAPETVTTALEKLRLGERMRLEVEADIPMLIAQAIAVGATWTEIGEVLGVTKAAAWNRYHLAAKP